MIPVPQSTVEKPLTAVDHCAELEKAQTITDVQNYAELVPLEIQQDERFGRAVAARMAAIKGRKFA